MPLTVKHLLAECLSHDDERNRIYPESHGMDPENIIKLMIAEEPDVQFNSDRITTYFNEIDILVKILLTNM